MKRSTHKLTAAAMLSAASYLLMLICKVIPEVSGFLQFDIKDVTITIGGFLLGPVYSLLIALVVVLLEFIFASDTGVIGLIMNYVATVAFCAAASLIYCRKRSLSSAIIGLGTGTIVLVAVMLLWNYYITPLYMGYPRSAIAVMLPTVFLPFNLIKGLINSAIILIVYRPLVEALRSSGIVERSSSAVPKKKFSLSIVIGLVLLVICIPILLSMIGII